MISKISAQGNSENNKKNRLKSILLFISVFMLIYATDTLVIGTNSNQSFISLLKYICILIAVVLVFYQLIIIKKIERDQFQIVLVCSFFLLSMFLAGGKFLSVSYVFRIACLIIAYTFSKMVGIEKFSRCYISIMRLIAIVSLLGYFFFQFFFALSLPEISNANDFNFKTLFFTNLPCTPYLQNRNFGPFWEPGVYQAYLNIGLFFVLFFEDRKIRVFDAIIFSITIITTLSGAAFISMIMVYATFIFNTKSTKKESLAKVLIIVLLFIVAYNIYYNEEYSDVITKVTQGFNNEETNSFSYRFSSLIASLRLFIKSPIWGNSPTLLAREIGNTSLSLTGVDSVSGIMNTYAGWFALYGAFVGGYLIYRTYKMTYSVTRSKLSAVLGLLAFILMTSNEDLTASLCFITVIMMTNKDDIFTSRKDPLSSPLANKLPFKSTK